LLWHSCYTQGPYVLNILNFFEAGDVKVRIMTL